MISGFSMGVVQSAAECLLHEKKTVTEISSCLGVMSYTLFLYITSIYFSSMLSVWNIIFSHRPHSARGATSRDVPFVYRADNSPFWHITRKNSVRSQNVSICRKVRILCDATKLFNSFSVRFHCEIFWIIFWVKRNLNSCLTEDSVDLVQS